MAEIFKIANLAEKGEEEEVHEPPEAEELQDKITVPPAKRSLISLGWNRQLKNLDLGSKDETQSELVDAKC